MKKKIRTIMVSMLSAVLIFSLTACGNQEKANTTAEKTPNAEQKADGAKEVKLIPGQTYNFEKLPTGSKDAEVKFSSGNSSVAEVREGKYIIAHNVGETTVTVDSGTQTDTYKVSVTESEDANRLLKTVNIKDQAVYLGAGYNAFTSDEYVSLNQINLSKGIITSKIVKNFRAAYKKALKEMKESDEYGEADVSDEDSIILNDDLVIYDDSNLHEFMTMQGSSLDSYIDSYETEIQGQLKLDIKGIVGAGANGKFNSLQAKKGSGKSVYNSVFAFEQRYKYMLQAPTEYLVEMAKSNKTAWKQLTGEIQTSPKDLFDSYGTHIITDALIGGRAELDYVMSSSDSSVTDNELMDISGELNVNVAAVKASGSGGYKSDKVKEALKNNMSIKTNVKTYGGKASSKNLMTDLDSFATGYKPWYDSLSDDKNVTFIGVSKTGLLPIWELLSTNEKYKDRMLELKKYYNKKMGIDDDGYYIAKPKTDSETQKKNESFLDRIVKFFKK